MEFLVALPIIALPFFFPVVTGLMAKSLGRKFWLWFWLGLPLPFVACVILLCLPVRRIERENEFRIY
ncbi:hypothetical protein A4H97_29235 [Niastella yeongjuensis]|uniref:Uncharacterized protein n=1 Tax=Niastella yeongjuensis TaxID=354355 RepID=A0A1V9ESA9_9BACT|nr:hypothetical protein A4H97_29235 [Niastella yeongjuensis]SEP09313.1 hypothetical protein SAMN05660816_04344 [Niastella yeongjuensis]